MKLNYLGHTLKRWNGTSHDCESDQLNPISCICTLLKGLTDDPLPYINQLIREQNSVGQLSIGQRSLAV